MVTDAGDAPPVAPAVPTPSRRVLRAFAFDPMSTRLTSRYLRVDVPFETDLQPGPAGGLLEVVDYDPSRRVWYRPVDLNDPFILAQQGMRPSESDPRTHQQIVYAVAMSVIERFERFGGRRFRWVGDERLKLVPHAFEGRNAYFDPSRNAVLFGYYRASASDPGANLPGQLMFTCLSVDIIAHEVTHAIVNRQRPLYQYATNPDVYAWHEAFADLVALFHHFLFPEVVTDAIATSRAELSQADALLDLAKEFGESTGRGEALRNAIRGDRTPDAFLQATEPHARGACFVAAVFDAYVDTYKEAIAGLRRLATGGSGVLPPGALPPDLVDLASKQAVRLADRFLGMVVRAFEFLPVVDVTLGDVVKAIVTADRALFPDDDNRLRSTLVEALRRRGIRPTGVTSLADEALAWDKPAHPLNLSTGPGGADLSMLIIDATRRLDVSDRGSHDEQAGAGDDDPAVRGRRIASDLHGWATANAATLGLDPDDAIQVRGFHVAYLNAADGQSRPVAVVQLLQRREDLEDAGASKDERVPMHAATTVIARVNGTVEHLVPKPLPFAAIRRAEEAAKAAKAAQLAARDAPDAEVAALALEAEKRANDLIDVIAAIAERFHTSADVVRHFHAMGNERLRRLESWQEKVAEDDPLTPWFTEPAVNRLNFARFHAAEAVAAQPEPADVGPAEAEGARP
ncbi:hypothetical protein [Microbacterium thalassium]|uniref:Peptidase M4 n=1 Tax=Microbacterium thalassium TaxID=362649 RepID=A0A7X0KVL0_9MICO|nr:hypothetical protein [Microbacterium thalassium]MBB6392355.1 hypothetical protein [Microbacterium thalassium]GLK23566.1 hypothetical protein GCM10017607_08840 [Microbacterium thalassium]